MTLSNPKDCSLPGFSVHGIFQARVLEGGAIAFSENIEEKMTKKEKGKMPNKSGKLWRRYPNHGKLKFLKNRV